MTTEDEIKRIAGMSEDDVLAMARKEHIDLRLTLARQIVNEHYFFGDFHPDAPDRATQESLCARMAMAEGWRDAGLFFKHPSDGEYRKSDLSGWRDLCSNEGILP